MTIAVDWDVKHQTKQTKPITYNMDPKYSIIKGLGCIFYHHHHHNQIFDQRAGADASST